MPLAPLPSLGEGSGAGHAVPSPVGSASAHTGLICAPPRKEALAVPWGSTWKFVLGCGRVRFGFTSVPGECCTGLTALMCSGQLDWGCRQSQHNPGISQRNCTTLFSSWHDCCLTVQTALTQIINLLTACPSPSLLLCLSPITDILIKKIPHSYSCCFPTSVSHEDFLFCLLLPLLCMGVETHPLINTPLTMLFICCSQTTSSALVDLSLQLSS